MHFILQGLASATEQLKGELHESEVLPITSTLSVVKDENIYQNTITMHKIIEAELSHETAFETLFLTMKINRGTEFLKAA